MYISELVDIASLPLLTNSWNIGTMKEQDKGSINNGVKVEFKEGERGPLSCNKAIVRSPSLKFNNKKILSFEEKQRLLNFFSILLKIDQRVHPEFYQRDNPMHNESNTSSQSIG